MRHISQALQRRYGRSAGVHSAMAKELWRKGKIAVRGEGGQQGFVIIMRPGSRQRADRINIENRGHYAPSLDGKTPETSWQSMTDTRLVDWLSSFRPVLRSVR
jgi:hypothetical protein